MIIKSLVVEHIFFRSWIIFYLSKMPLIINYYGLSLFNNKQKATCYSVHICSIWNARLRTSDLQGRTNERPQKKQQKGENWKETHDLATQTIFYDILPLVSKGVVHKGLPTRCLCRNFMRRKGHTLNQQTSPGSQFLKVPLKKLSLL